MKRLLFLVLCLGFISQVQAKKKIDLAKYLGDKAAHFEKDMDKLLENWNIPFRSWKLKVYPRKKKESGGGENGGGGEGGGKCPCSGGDEETTEAPKGNCPCAQGGGTGGGSGGNESKKFQPSQGQQGPSMGQQSALPGAAPATAGGYRPGSPQDPAYNRCKFTPQVCMCGDEAAPPAGAATTGAPGAATTAAAGAATTGAAGAATSAAAAESTAAATSAAASMGYSLWSDLESNRRQLLELMESFEENRRRLQQYQYGPDGPENAVAQNVFASSAQQPYPVQPYQPAYQPNPQQAYQPPNLQQNYPVAQDIPVAGDDNFHEHLNKAADFMNKAAEKLKAYGEGISKGGDEGEDDKEGDDSGGGGCSCDKEKSSDNPCGPCGGANKVLIHERAEQQGPAPAPGAQQQGPAPAPGAQQQPVPGAPQDNNPAGKNQLQPAAPPKVDPECEKKKTIYCDRICSAFSAPNGAGPNAAPAAGAAPASSAAPAAAAASSEAPASSAAPAGSL